MIRCSSLFVLITFGLVGCDALDQWRTPKSENPVMSAPPPRISMSDGSTGKHRQTTELTTPTNGQGGVVPIGLERTEKNSIPSALSNSQVVATVNGEPVFAGPLLERYYRILQQAEKRFSPEDYQRYRLAFIQKGLNRYIDRVILVQALKRELKPEQLTALDEGLNEMFVEETQRIMKKVGARTVQELEEKMAVEGTSLKSIEESFKLEIMAMEYVKKHTEKPTIGRRELYEYYVAHREDYRQPAKVKWEQVLVSFRRHGGKEPAFEMLQRAVNDLRQGRDFAEVAKVYSDGPTKEQGGLWDWMEAGGLSNKEVERALFQLPVGQISPPFASDKDFQLVRVVDRTEVRYTPFEELQDEIKKAIYEEARLSAREELVKKLREEVKLETIFDKQKTL